MNSDKIRARIAEVVAMDSVGDQIEKILEFYFDFMKLLARNKVSSIPAAAATALEMESVARRIISEAKGSEKQQEPEKKQEEKKSDQSINKEATQSTS